MSYCEFERSNPRFVESNPPPSDVDIRIGNNRLANIRLIFQISQIVASVFYGSTTVSIARFVTPLNSYITEISRPWNVSSMFF